METLRPPAQKSSTKDEIQWKGDKLLFQGHEFVPSQIQTLAYGLIERTWREMLQKLFLISKDETAKQVLPPLSMDKLQDDPPKLDPGFSFLQKPSNKWPVDGKKWLRERIIKSSSFKKEFLQASGESGGSESASGQPEWNTARAEKYLRDVAQFKERLLVLMHTTGGPPPRSVDILKLRYKNGSSGDHRTMFVESGMVVYATMFFKPDLQVGTHSPEVAPRYMPPEVSQMIVYYLWLILPFQEELLAKLQNKTQSTPFLWDSDFDVDGKKWDKSRMDEVLQRETETAMGTKLNLRSYRKVAFAMMRKLVDTQQLFEDSEGED